MAYDPSTEAEDAAGLLALARQTHEAHVAAARKKAEDIIARAQEEADTILTNAREEFSWLEQKIAEHREFEVRYREALKNYLSELLEEVSQEDEFTAPAGLAPAAAASAFAVAEEDDEVDVVVVVEEEVVEVVPEPFFAPEPVVAPEPEYVAEPAFEETELAEEPAVDAAVEEFVAEEETFEAPEPEAAAVETDEFVYETPVAEAPGEPDYYLEPELEATEEYSYSDEVAAENELVPTYAEGEAPVPSAEGVAEDLPEAPEFLDSYASAADEIEELENEVQEHGPETEEEIESFDSLLAEPKPATDSVVTQSPLFGETPVEPEDAEKAVRGFFGFKKN